ncbi:MAG: sensor histidine kinase [Microscillaceae bacterium]|nr:sensor histidine kinase [Microscillaceae bacterium]
MNQITVAQNIVKISSQQWHYNLGDQVEVLEDKTKKVSLAQIRANPQAFAFKKSAQPIPNFGYSHAHYWFRFRIKSSDLENINWYLHFNNHFIDTLIVYQFTDNQLISTKQIGDLLPYHQRYLDYRTLLIPLDLQAQRTYEVYVHFRGTFSKRLPIEVVEISDFLAKDQYTTLWQAIISGLFIALILYNIFLYWGIRDRSYLYYVGYLLCFLLVQLAYTGFANQLLFKNYPAFANIAFNFLVCPTLIFSNLFALYFLQIPQYYPIIGRIIGVANGLLALVSLLFLYCIIAPHNVLITNQLGVLVGFPMIILIYIVSFFIFFRKCYNPAQYYIWAWGAVYLGFVLFLLKTINLLPSNFVTEYGFQIGSAVEALLLSLGLANRVNQEKQEKLHLLRENEAIVREQNFKLEDKVRKRTHEINEINNELQQLNEELLQINETLHAQKSNLIELNHEKDGLMSVLAHDLRSPLNKIRGLLELMQEEAQMTEEQLSFAQLIENICKQSTELIEDILTLNSLSQTQNRAMISIDLIGFVQKHLADFQQAAHKKNIDIEIQTPDNEIVMIKGLKNHLSRILDNLLSNALKFSYSCTTINVSIGKNEHWAWFIIQDQGQGIKPEERIHLFKKFQKLAARPTAGESSTGLGLAIVKALIDDLKGEIEVQSDWGKGSTFKVFLPLVA